MRRLAASLLVLALAGTSGAAQAEADLFSRDTVAGLLDLRAAASDGEDSWLDGGYGKTRYGESGLELANAQLVWRPRLSWSLSGVVDVAVQPNVDSDPDVVEAYLTWKPMPKGATRVSGRLGLMYPPVSLEHEGMGWNTTETITPSAINSWIGEEVKVGAAELTVRRDWGEAGGRIGATVGVFGWNDTSGTLLAFRGWALHDVKATAYSDFTLPPQTSFIVRRQAPITTPTFEIDHRAGAYAKLEWRPAANLGLSAFYYDNGGNLTGVARKQWAWDTRFFVASADWDVDERTRVRAQALSGVTLMGFNRPEVWVDVDYASAYAMVSRTYGEAAVSARLEWFETRDNTMQAQDDNDEHGWAATAAWRRPLTPYADLFLEALHVDSTRPGRATAHVAPAQQQTTLQAALRLSF